MQQNLKFNGILNSGYILSYTYANNSQQIANIADASYRADRSGGAYGTGRQQTDVLNEKTQSFTYDANGNMTYVASGKKLNDSTLQATSSRQLLWDEENRLLAISDNGYVSNYWYDAAGERTVKQSGGSEGVFVNGVLSGANTETGRFTAYISPYMVVSNGGNYSKHIYMGSQRIVSKLSNSGIFAASPVTVTDQQARYALQTSKIKERFDSLGVVYNGTAQTGGLMSATPASTASSYFYHPDHLGSSSLITDGTGALTQHIQYVPFGEVFVEERTNSWSTPYKFNGKELDEETGLYYYHARYYDPRLSVWMSVDPLAEKYPNWSSYVYTFNDPVNYTDPDGREPMKGRWVNLSETKHYNNYPALAYSQQFIPEDKYLNSQFFFVRLNSGLNLSISPDRKASINVPGQKEWYPIDINKLSRGGCLSCEISALAMAIPFEIADDVVKYGIPALTMLGGAVAIATLAQSGGGSVSGFKAFRMMLTALSGSWAVVGGGVKLMLNIQGNTDLANIIPTDFLNATIGIICETTINDKKSLSIIKGTLSASNGILTFNFSNPNDIQTISNISNIIGIIDSAGNVINNVNEE